MLGKLASIIEISKNEEEFYYYLQSAINDDFYSLSYSNNINLQMLKSLTVFLEKFIPDKYYKGYFETKISDNGRGRILLAVGNNIIIEKKLKISKIQYSSPGFTDLTGVGQLLGHLKDIIIKLIESYETRDKRKLRNRLLEIEVLEKHNQFLKKIGFSELERKGLFSEVSLSVEILKKAVLNNRIKKAEEIEE